MLRRLKHACWLGPWLLFLAAFGWARWLHTGAGFQLWLGLNIWGALTFLYGWLAYQAIRKYATDAGLTGYALCLGLLGGGLLYAVARYWLQESTYYQPDAPALLPFLFLFTCWSALMCAYNRSNIFLRESLEQQQSAASLHREAALFKLRQQLQPHFLYNSLNSINALIAISPTEAQRMVVKLSDFLRSAVRQEHTDRVPWPEEQAYLQQYLDIELIRFGHRLRIDWQVSVPEAATLPPLLLQPLLENAIKYGLYGVSDAVTIAIHVSQEEGLLVCRITNPLPQDAPLAQGGTGFGLHGLQQRLQLLFARADLLTITREDHYFTATLRIPQQIQDRQLPSNNFPNA